MTRQPDDSTRDRTPDEDDGRFSNLSTNRILWITVFIVIFSIIGTFAPAYFYQYAGTDTFLTIHSTTVSEQPENTTAVAVTIDRTARNTYAGNMVVELLRVREGYVERVTAYTIPAVIEGGREKTRLTLNTPPLPPGEYHLAISTTIHLPHTVERQVAWQSNTFSVVEDEPSVPDGEAPDSTPTPTATPTNTTANATRTPTNTTATPTATPTPTAANANRKAPA